LPELSGSESYLLDALRDHGAVILRDRRYSLSDFEDLTGRFMVSFAHHSVATHEREVVGQAAANIATVNRGSDPIPLHRESSFLPTQPDVLALYCERPARQGGQTTLCDGVALLAALPADVRAFLEGQVLVWRFRMPPERWHAVFGTDSPQAATARIKELMVRAPEATYEFVFDGQDLDGTYRAPFILPTYWGKVPALSTSVLGYFHRRPGPYVAKNLHEVTLGDGRAVPADVLEAIAGHGEALAIEVEWNAGDVVVVDNSRVMHGRRAVTDPQRRILARFGHYRPEVAPGDLRPVSSI
jgi:hypothetical protein